MEVWNEETAAFKLRRQFISLVKNYLSYIDVTVLKQQRKVNERGEEEDEYETQEEYEERIMFCELPYFNTFDLRIQPNATLQQDHAEFCRLVEYIWCNIQQDPKHQIGNFKMSFSELHTGMPWYVSFTWFQLHSPVSSITKLSPQLYRDESISKMRNDEQSKYFSFAFLKNL